MPKDKKDEEKSAYQKFKDRMASEYDSLSKAVLTGGSYAKAANTKQVEEAVKRRKDWKKKDEE